jgi:hypothetical protein
MLFDCKVLSNEAQGLRSVLRFRPLQHVGSGRAHDGRRIPKHTGDERFVELRQQAGDVDGQAPD